MPPQLLLSPLTIISTTLHKQHGSFPNPPRMRCLDSPQKNRPTMTCVWAAVSHQPSTIKMLSYHTICKGIKIKLVFIFPLSAAVIDSVGWAEARSICHWIFSARGYIYWLLLSRLSSTIPNPIPIIMKSWTSLLSVLSVLSVLYTGTHAFRQVWSTYWIFSRLSSSKALWRLISDDVED